MAHPPAKQVVPPPPARAEVLAFLSDIKAHPEDDTPRLIFADWLQEYGGPEGAARGELMALQVRRAHVHGDDPQWGLLKRRENRLIWAYLDRWLGCLLNESRAWEFRRGLIHLEMRAEKLLAEQTADLLSTDVALWIDSLVLSDVGPAHLEGIAQSPLLPHLATLDLGNNRLRGGLEALTRSPGVSRLNSLLLVGNRLGAAGIVPLTEESRLDNLAILDLSVNQLNDEAAERLASSAYLSRLRELHVGHNRIGPRGMERLRERFGDRVRL